MAQSWLAASLVLTTFACGTADANGDALSDENLTSSKAALDRTISSPIPELSGLGLRKTTGGVELLTVGDRNSTIAHGLPSASTLEALTPTGDTNPQRESIASDSTGRIFVLGETSGIMTIFEPNGKTVKHTITVAYPSSWSSGNAGAESFVLLKNGHILLVKEKAPVTIAEVGPEGEAPTGYKKGLGVRYKDTFPLPSGSSSKRVILKTWALGDNTGKVATDVSDAAISPTGDLYLLTDQGRAILQMQDGISIAETKVKALKVWTLPTEIKKPEGLTFLDDGTPIVASDMPDPGAQIFVLKKLQ